MKFRTQATVDRAPRLCAPRASSTAAPRPSWRSPQHPLRPASRSSGRTRGRPSSAGGHQYAEIAEHPGVDARLARGDRSSGSTPTRSPPRSPPTQVAGLLAAEALRVAAWRPRWSAEVDERSLPHESDWIRTAVHLNKGCYRGQETVAKVHNLGHPPRRLAALHLDGSEAVLPAVGDARVRRR